MRRKVAGALLLGVLALALAACSSDSDKGPDVNPNIYPAKYKQEIIATLSQLLSDPTHVRNGLISDPALMTINKEPRYVACVRFTERDPSTGLYGEPDTRIAYFYGGTLNQLVKAVDNQCATAAYKPFHEVEKMCLVEHCS
jgi:hypothetical protein